MTLAAREAAWDLVLKLYILPEKDKDKRAAIVMHYSNQCPLPESRSQAICDALDMKDFSLTLQTETSNPKEVCQEKPKTQPPT